MGKPIKNARFSLDQLSPREQQTLALLATGISTEEVAARMKTAVKTTRTHVQNMLRKTGFHSRVELVVEYFKSGAGA